VYSNHASNFARVGRVTTHVLLSFELQSDTVHSILASGLYQLLVELTVTVDSYSPGHIHLKFTMSGQSRQTNKHMRNVCSHVSVGLAQAHPHHWVSEIIRDVNC